MTVCYSHHLDFHLAGVPAAEMKPRSGAGVRTLSLAINCSGNDRLRSVDNH